MTTDTKRAQIINQLLAQAESTNYPEEAKAFSAKAQKLMAKWAIDDAVLNSVNNIDSLEIDVEIIPITANYLSATKASLLNIIGKYNNCRVIKGWKNQENIDLHIIGAASDRSWVQTLFLSLLTQETRESAIAWMLSEISETPQAFATSFQMGYNNKIREQLREAYEIAERDAAKEHGQNSVALVVQSKADAVNLKTRELFPNLQSAGRGKNARSQAGYSAGQIAGAQASTGRGNKVGSGALRLGAKT